MAQEELKGRIFSLLKRLCEVSAPSGRESQLAQLVVEELGRRADRLYTDSLGNVVAVKEGSGEAKVMLAAHMDEIGLFVSHVEDDGFLRVTPIGGLPERALIYQRVLVITRDGRTYRGVVGLKPPHIAKPEEAQKVPEMRELFVDVGASSREEVERLGIRVGDVAVFDRSVERLAGDRATGKAFDDRTGLAVMIEAFNAIESNEVDVYAVATVQEEVGLKGARTSAFAIAPDAALALDVTIASDVPGVPKSEWYTSLGKGPAIKVADGRSASGLIAHPAIVDFLVRLAEENKIPYQLEVAAGGTTDASVIALNREGVPAGVISIPARYIHSPVEVVDLNDMANAVALTKLFAERARVDWVKSLKGRIYK
ncbi:MAG: M42 family metallopeptidase [Desulfurococcaceae archaeon]